MSFCRSRQSREQFDDTQGKSLGALSQVGFFLLNSSLLLAARDGLCDGAPPVVAEFYLALVEPDIVPALREIGLESGGRVPRWRRGRN